MNNFSITTPLNLAPTGIASFAKSSICQDIREFEGDIAILGAPFDMSIQGRSGCRIGCRKTWRADGTGGRGEVQEGVDL